MITIAKSSKKKTLVHKHTRNDELFLHVNDFVKPIFIYKTNLHLEKRFNDLTRWVRIPTEAPQKTLIPTADNQILIY